jgi:hypothetical protein
MATGPPFVAIGVPATKQANVLQALPLI